MLSQDRRLPPGTWNLSESHLNVFVNPRPVFDSSQTPYQGSLHSVTPRATGAVAVQGVRNKEETPYSLFKYFNFQIFLILFAKRASTAIPTLFQKEWISRITESGSLLLQR